MQNKKLHYYLQTLSPVHAGNGVRLRRGLDYFAAGGRTWMVDQNALADALTANAAAMNEFVSEDEPDIHKLAHQHHLDLGQILATGYRGEATARDMFAFVRTGKGVPYLPGSSVKGALRTALLWKLSQAPDWQKDVPSLMKKILHPHNERAGQVVIEKAFNIAAGRKRPNDANRDLMRVLHISDAHFAAGDLELADVRIFNLVSETRYGWKNIPRRRNESEPRRATQLAAEALRIGAATAITLTIDEFLLHSPAAQKEATFAEYSGLFHALPAICNEYAARQISRQRAFFAKYGLNALVQFYEELECVRANLPEGDFLLRLSWGSGWQGMTGEVLEDPDDLQKVRKRFNLGKFEYAGELPDECPVCGSDRIRPDNRKPETGFCLQGRHSFPAEGLKKILFPVFPKTRKIALQAGQPRYPLGWVVFRQEQPDIPPMENRDNLQPPAYKPVRREAALPRKQKPQPTPKVATPVAPEPVAAIRWGDKIRAEVIKVEGIKFTVRLLQKDTGRERSFTRAYLPIKTGDTVEVRVLATNKVGDEVTKIEFVKKISIRKD